MGAKCAQVSLRRDLPQHLENGLSELRFGQLLDDTGLEDFDINDALLRLDYSDDIAASVL
jgi:hypothetical protein